MKYAFLENFTIASIKYFSVKENIYFFFFPVFNALYPPVFRLPSPTFYAGFFSPFALEETLHFQAAFSFCQSNPAPCFSKTAPLSLL